MEYTPPEFLQNQSVDDIHARMMEIIPNGTDMSEGQIPWDFTRPAALEAARFVEFNLNETVKLMFPQWAYGAWLDLHAFRENVTRRPANRAFGLLEIVGIEGTVIPQGFRFSTITRESPGVEFETIDAVELSGTPNADGFVSVLIPVRAVLGGVDGNVLPEMVILQVEPMEGIVSATNSSAMTGGTPEENDESLRLRLLETIRDGTSFTGCIADYVRWAKQVPGIGDVVVLPEKHGAGTVELVLIDSNGLPANDQLLSAVERHISGYDATDPNRLAPIGATVTFSAPSDVQITIDVTVVCTPDMNRTVVESLFIENLNALWKSIAKEAREREDGSSSVRLTRVGAVLSETQGVADYSNLTINSDTENIPIYKGQFPVLAGVTLHG